MKLCQIRPGGVKESTLQIIGTRIGQISTSLFSEDKKYVNSSDNIPENNNKTNTINQGTENLSLNEQETLVSVLFVIIIYLSLFNSK